MIAASRTTGPHLADALDANAKVSPRTRPVRPRPGWPRGRRRRTGGRARRPAARCRGPGRLLTAAAPAALADDRAAAGRAGAAGAGPDRLPARAAVHRHAQVPVQRLAGHRPARVQGSAQGHPAGRQPAGRSPPCSTCSAWPWAWASTPCCCAAACRAGWPRWPPRRCCSTRYELQIEQTIMPDVWFEALIVAALVLLLWRPRPTPRTIALAGIALGLAVTVRPGRRGPDPARGDLRGDRGRRLAPRGPRRWWLMCVSFAVPILAYMSISDAVSGHFWLSRSGETTHLRPGGRGRRLRDAEAARPTSASLCPTRPAGRSSARTASTTRPSSPLTLVPAARRDEPDQRSSPRSPRR